MPDEQAPLTLSIPTAAALVGMHPHTLRKAIREGKVKAAMVGRVMKISRAELAKYWREIGGGDLFQKGNQGDSHVQ